MSRLALAPLAALLLTTPLLAQSKSKSKAPAPPFKPDPLTLVPGQPMSSYALTQRPGLLAGLRGWSIETRRHRGPIYSFAFSPDEKLLATGGHDCTIRLWDVATGKLLHALIGHNYVVTALSFSPDGHMLASAGSADGTFRVWDVETAQPLRSFPMKAGAANWVAWSPDGRTLAGAGGTSGYVWLYDVGADKGDVIAEAGNPIYAIAWAPDSSLLAVASTKVPLWLVNRESGKLLQTLGEAVDAPQSIAWAPDSKSLVVGSVSAVHVWDVPGQKKKVTITTPGALVAW